MHRKPLSSSELPQRRTVSLRSVLVRTAARVHPSASDVESTIDASEVAQRAILSHLLRTCLNNLGHLSCRLPTKCVSVSVLCSLLFVFVRKNDRSVQIQSQLVKADAELKPMLKGVPHTPAECHTSLFKIVSDYCRLLRQVHSPAHGTPCTPTMVGTPCNDSWKQFCCA